MENLTENKNIYTRELLPLDQSLEYSTSDEDMPKCVFYLTQWHESFHSSHGHWIMNEVYVWYCSGLFDVYAKLSFK